MFTGEGARISMRTTLTMYVSVVVLLLGFFWNLPAGSHRWTVQNGHYMELLSSLVCLSALLLATPLLGREASPLKVLIDGEVERPRRQCQARTT
jgi:hypothetical protein